MTTVSELITDAKVDDLVLLAGDALESHAAAQARVVATYFRNLVSGGIPPELAERLTFDWHAYKPDGKFWLVKTHRDQQ